MYIDSGTGESNSPVAISTPATPCCATQLSPHGEPIFASAACLPASSRDEHAHGSTSQSQHDAASNSTAAIDQCGDLILWDSENAELVHGCFPRHTPSVEVVTKLGESVSRNSSFLRKILVRIETGHACRLAGLSLFEVVGVETLWCCILRGCTSWLETGACSDCFKTNLLLRYRSLPERKPLRPSARPSKRPIHAR